MPSPPRSAGRTRRWRRAPTRHSPWNWFAAFPAPDGVAPPPQSPEEEQSPLERFGRDLTEIAEQGKLDPVIGRDDEIRRVIQVLSRRTKNNPVLIGEPGVGK